LGTVPGADTVHFFPLQQLIKTPPISWDRIITKATDESTKHPTAASTGHYNIKTPAPVFFSIPSLFGTKAMVLR